MNIQVSDVASDFPVLFIDIAPTLVAIWPRSVQMVNLPDIALRQAREDAYWSRISITFASHSVLWMVLGTMYI